MGYEEIIEQKLDTMEDTIGHIENELIRFILQRDINTLRTFLEWQKQENKGGKEL